MNDQFYTTVVYHDYFSIRGGGERLVLELTRHLDASLVCGFRTEKSYSLSDFPLDVRALLPLEARRFPGLGSIELALRFAAEKPRAAEKKIRIFSGVTAPFAAPRRSVSGVNIFYCHTPPRFLYDQRAFFASKSDLLRRSGMAVVGPVFQHGYERAVSRMDVIVANSENIKRRIQAYLGRESVVVYPPVDTAGFQWSKPKGYYLSTARLTPLKRIRTIIDAFLQMPDKTLVVASGGDQERELKELAAGANNIRFTGWTDDEDLKALVAGAIATIYIPVEEDFGMSPVESMAAGKPVIGVAEGGLLETIVPGETGLLLPPNPTSDALIRAVERMTPAMAHDMRQGCELRAQLFTRERFLAGMQQVIAKALQDKQFS